MIPLIILITVFVLVAIGQKMIQGHYRWAFSGRSAMSVMLLFTASGHFFYTEGMAMMLPEFIPFRVVLVYETGIAEVLAAVGLHVPKWRTLTGWLLILLFIFILPANVYASLEQINYQTASPDGYGPAYLWFRIPLQILFIAWIYISAIKAEDASSYKWKGYAESNRI